MWPDSDDHDLRGQCEVCLAGGRKLYERDLAEMPMSGIELRVEWFSEDEKAAVFACERCVEEWFDS